MKPNEFLDAIKSLGITLTKEKEHLLNIYANFLLEYNEHTNLTAIKTVEEVYLKHFYDSLTLTKIANLEQGKLLDIGTGVGFPGLVLAIVFPNLEVTLLDSNNKKILFLQECLKKLNLSNVKIIYNRAEEYTKNHREVFDYVTSRAVAELRILLELGIPSLKVNGSYLVMKGIIQEELENSQKTLKNLSCEIILKEEFELPNQAGHRTLLKIKKEKPTDLKYPRRYDQIKKKA